MWINVISLRHRFGPGIPGPHHTITIDPQQIDSILFGFSSHNKAFTYVRGGQWDRRRSDESIALYGVTADINKPTIYSFDQYLFAESLEDRFERGTSWDETPLWKHLETHQATIERESGIYSDAFGRLREIDELYDEMSETGYLSQRDLLAVPWPIIGTPPSTREVKVAIGRNGEIIFVDGRHRFVLAKVLGISQVPAQVILRHREWISKKNEIADSTTELSADLRDEFACHPDVQHLLPDSSTRESTS